MGLAHLFAATAADAYRALGYVMATDRLWQMDLMRRLGSGRVAEILGAPFLALDVVAHTVGLPAAAATATRTLRGEAAEVVDAFSEGVSACIASAPLPPEFEALGYAPEPWRPIDCAAIECFVGFGLALESLEAKCLLARALGALGAERGAWLYPFPLPRHLLDAERLTAYRRIDGSLFEALRRLTPPPAGGSNAWAVSGARTAGGAALLAGDPHLLHAAPSPWYPVHLVAPGLDVAGAAYVGGPLVQVGRNRDGAWSVTNLTADDAEVVLERLDAEGRRVEIAPGRFEPVQAREVSIAVRGDDPYRLTVRSTPNGPLLDGIATLAGAADAVPTALRWKGAIAPGVSVSGWLAVHRSRGLEDVLRAGADFDEAPFETNFIYADTKGHVAHLALGSVPRRTSETGFLPALGWRGEGTWDGLGSLGSVPWRVDPTDGVVWTANETTGAADRAAAGNGQPYGEMPYRARRIESVLLGGTQHTAGDFARLQLDDLDLGAQANLPALRDALLGWEPGDARLARARDLLLGWDARASAASAAAALYHVFFYAEWIPAILPGDLCPGFAERWRIATWGAEAVLRAARSPWFADGAAKATAVRACLERAVGRLRVLAGDDPGAWRWGDLHRIAFSHPLAFFPRLAKGALPPLAVGGTPFTVNQQRLGSALPPFGAVVGAGVRMVADLGRPGHLRLALSTGVSGDPESPHFADHLPAWETGELLEIVLDPARLDVESEATLAPPGPTP
jgi:penicillin G amidase